MKKIRIRIQIIAVHHQNFLLFLVPNILQVLQTNMLLFATKKSRETAGNQVMRVSVQIMDGKLPVMHQHKKKTLQVLVNGKKLVVFLVKLAIRKMKRCNVNRIDLVFSSIPQCLWPQTSFESHCENLAPAFCYKPTRSIGKHKLFFTMNVFLADIVGFQKII